VHLNFTLPAIVLSLRTIAGNVKFKCTEESPNWQQREKKHHCWRHRLGPMSCRHASHPMWWQIFAFCMRLVHTVAGQTNHITYYIFHITYYILHITYYILHISRGLSCCGLSFLPHHILCRALIKDPGFFLKDPGVLMKDPGVLSIHTHVTHKSGRPRSQRGKKTAKKQLYSPFCSAL